MEEDFPPSDPPVASQDLAENLEHQPNTASSPTGSLLPETEYQEYIAQYPFAAEPSYFTRPNRYYGPASTWRSWTAEDRAVADAVDTERARDLSVHLYNAFALKQKAKAKQAGDGRRVGSRSRSRSRRRQAVDGDDEAVEEARAFVPPDVWTAWPLPAHRVPREHQSFGQSRDSRPSAKLEEALIATTLRHAKEQWNARAWEPVQPVLKREKRDWHKEQDLTKKQLIASGVLKQEEVTPRNDGLTSQSEPKSLPDSEDLLEEEDEILPEGVQTFTSQAFAADSSSSSSASEDLDAKGENSEDDRPVFTADDDYARSTLLPGVRHTLSKLDDLLTGLHKARQAYAAQPHDNDSRSRSRSRPRSVSLGRGESIDNDDEAVVRSGSRASIRKGRQSESRKRGRKRKRGASTDAEDDEDKDEDVVLPSRSRSRAKRSQAQGKSQARSSSRHPRSASSRRQQKPPNLGLRDWSDILGMATLTGWNTQTVGRAAERCAKLFGENMLFRTFHEAEAGGEGNGEAVFEESLAYVPSDQDQEAAEGEAEQAKEATEGAKAKDIVASPTMNVGALSLGDRDKDYLTCPVASCPQARHVYARRARLYDHVRQAHPDFDLESYKVVVGKRGGRGKYDRSQMRSRSGGRAQTQQDEDIEMDSDSTYSD